MRVLLPALTIVAVLNAFAQGGTTRITVVGEFSNMRFTEEHAYGYTVELWREGDTVFGLFSASEGLAGDTPTGMLDEVKFDSRTGKLSFKAKLTIGAAYLGNGKQEPSRDLFEFEGALSRSAVAGTLKHSDMLRAAGAATSQRIRLSRRTGNAMTAPESYDAWKRMTSEILKFRGPKW
jgi:hypothetical protein